MTKQHLTIKEAAERHSVSISTIQRLVRQGRLRRTVISARCIRYRVADLDDCFEEQTTDIPLRAVV